jgi:hypothetical protein
MSTSLTDIKTDLITNVKFQKTPIPMTDDDYMSFVIKAAKRYYVDCGMEDEFNSDYDKVTYTLNKDLSLSDLEYILLASEIAFRTQIKDDLADIVGYSTDALSITGADKPYKNIQSTINDLETRLSKLAFKFTHKKV